MSEATLGTPPAAAPAATTTSTSAESTAPVSAAERAQQVTEPSAAPEKAPPTKAEVRKSAAAALREHLAKGKADGDAKPAKPAAETKPAAAEPVKEAAQRGPDGKFAGQAGKAPALPEKPAQSAQVAPQQPARPDGELETRLSRTVRELNNTTAQVNDYKRKHETTSAENTQLKAKLEAAKTNPLDLLEELGWNYEKLTQGIVEKNLRPRAQRMELPPEIKQQLDELKADKEERVRREQTEAYQRMRTNESASIKAYVEKNAEQFPFAATQGWAAETVWDIAMSGSGGKPTAALPVLQDFEKRFAANVAAAVGNERALKALLTSQPQLRDKLIAALGISTSKEASPAASTGAGDGSADGPRSVSSLLSGQTPPPPDKLSKEQRKQQAVKAFREHRQAAG